MSTNSLSLITCRFCNLSIEESKLSAHYRKLHKATDLVKPVPRTAVPRTRKVRTVRSTPTKECIMCFENHDTLLLPCNHDSSCSNCLMRWWKTSFHSPRCPMCRTDVENIKDKDIVLKLWYNWRKRQLNQGTARRDNRIPSFIY